MNHPDKTVYFEDLGTTDYRQAWELQTQLFDRTRARKTANRTAEHPLPTEDFLLLTQHPPVYTLGRHGDPSHLLVTPETLQREGVGFFHIDRGGDITFHGPGQIVGSSPVWPTTSISSPEKPTPPDMFRQRRSAQL